LIPPEYDGAFADDAPDPKKKPKTLKDLLDFKTPSKYSLVDQEVNLRPPPSMLQALMLPFFEIPKPKGFKGKLHEDPKLDQLKFEVKVCTALMLVFPISVFFYVRSYFEDPDDSDRDLYPTIAAVIAVHIIIFAVIIYKHGDDFKAIWNGEGDVPYDPQQRQMVAKIRAKYEQKDR